MDTDAQLVRKNRFAISDIQCPSYGLGGLELATRGLLASGTNPEIFDWFPCTGAPSKSAAQSAIWRDK